MNAVSIALLVLTTLGTLYYILSTMALMRHFRKARAGSPLSTLRSPLTTSLLKPVSGVDANARESFRSFMMQDYPDYEVLFGVLEPNDPAVGAISEVVQGADNAALHVGSGIQGSNNKVRILHNLAARARGEILVVTDADTRVTPDFLRRITRPFEDTRVGAVTCLYRGITAGACAKPQPARFIAKTQKDEDAKEGRAGGPRRGLGGRGSRRAGPFHWTLSCFRSFAFSRLRIRLADRRLSRLADALEGLHMTCVFAPGVAAANALGGIDFGLGAAIAVRRSALDAIGGFEAIADYLADDYQLCHRIAGEGYRVVLSDYVVRIVFSGEPLRAVLQRELRWSRTTRVSRPAGHFGLVATFGFTYALGSLVASGLSVVGWYVLAGVLAVRLATAWLGARICLGDREFPRRMCLLPVRDVLSFGIWIAGYFSNTVEWRGRKLRILRDGRMIEKP